MFRARCSGLVFHTLAARTADCARAQPVLGPPQTLHREPSPPGPGAGPWLRFPFTAFTLWRRKVLGALDAKTLIPLRRAQHEGCRQSCAPTAKGAAGEPGSRPAAAGGGRPGPALRPGGRLRMARFGPRNAPGANRGAHSLVNRNFRLMWPQLNFRAGLGAGAGVSTVGVREHLAGSAPRSSLC